MCLGGLEVVCVRRAAVACQRPQDPPDIVLAHRDLDVHAVIAGARKPRAPYNHVAVLCQRLHDVELVVVEQLHEAVLALAQVGLGCEDLKGSVRLAGRLDLIRVVRLEQPLQPKRVDVARRKRVARRALRCLLYTSPSPRDS